MEITFNYGKANKWDGEDEFVMAKTRNCYGYNWWLWIPFFRLRFVSYGIYLDTSWLCYWWGFFLNYTKPIEYPTAQDCDDPYVGLSPDQLGALRLENGFKTHYTNGQEQ